MPRAMSRPREPGGDGLDGEGAGGIAEAHDGALAELLFDVSKGEFEGFGLFGNRSHAGHDSTGAFPRVD